MQVMRSRTLVNREAFDILYEEAAKDSAKYIKRFIKESVIADGGWGMVVLKNVKGDGLYLEFGVYKGESINFYSKSLPEKTFYGFDSFEGFQEDWLGGYFCKGDFDLKGQLPTVNKNVKLIKGWIKNTLPKFLLSNDKKISFIHMDVDTYESTKEVLEILGPKRFVKGSIILFDQYHSYIGWQHGEFKAWKKFVKKHKIKYKYIMFGTRQAVIKII